HHRRGGRGARSPRPSPRAGLPERRRAARDARHGGAGARRLTAFVAAGAGFLLAVLWFDLMFDVQVLAHRGGGDALPEEVLASISAYYRRVTTTARPMNRLVATAMVATLAAIVAQIAAGDAPRWVAWASLALVCGAIAVAAAHTVPAAVR